MGKESRDCNRGSTRMIRYQPAGLQVNMRFTEFGISGLLMVGSIRVLCFLFTLGLIGTGTHSGLFN